MFAALILRERLTTQRIAAVALATLGVLLILDPSKADFSSQTFVGNLALAFAAVTWGLYSVLVRKVYDVAGAGHGEGSRLNLRYAWPSGDWGSLPIAGGLEAAYRRELEAAEDPKALRDEIEARLNAVRSPFRTAERFSVEEIIDPRDTRPLLCDWASRAHELIRYELAAGPKARGPRA